MKQYPPAQIRNVALISHGGAGKTSLTEAMLLAAGAISRRGSVEEGNTVSDHDPEEQRRQISLGLSVCPLEWQDCKVNLLDTPGYSDFVGEVKQALRIADAAILQVCAVNGIEVGTELVSQYAAERQLPLLAVIGRLDREHADFEQALAGLKMMFGNRAALLHLPIGHERSTRGYVDLLTQKAHLYTDGDAHEEAVPEELADRAAEAREALIDAVAELDDDLLARYLDGQEISAAELRPIIRRGVGSGSLVPVLCTAATQGIGVPAVLDAIVQFLPSPEEAGTADVKGPLAALVFKTTSDPFVGKVSYFRVYSGTFRADAHVWNSSRLHEERVAQVATVRGRSQEVAGDVVAGDIGAINKLGDTATGDTLSHRDHPVVLDGISYPDPAFHVSVEPRTKADLDKLGPALARLMEEDHTITVKKDPDTGQTILSGMGEMHLDVAMERLRHKYKLELVLATPRVPYRETIRGRGKAQGRHKKQTGGHGQFGDVWIELEPAEAGGGYQFVDRVVGGSVPRQFIPAVDKGVQEALAEGIISGNRVVDIRAILYDGSYHPVDSSEMAFKLAAGIAVRKAAEQARPVLLEPILEVTITVPEASMGDVMSDLNTKRARIEGMEPTGAGLQRIKAQAPQAELLRYAIDLRSITQGRGVFSTSFSHYEEVPAHISDQVKEATAHKREHEPAHV
ncbi:MAG: elongation factor G [Chloroflexota bacterium]